MLIPESGTTHVSTVLCIKHVQNKKEDASCAGETRYLLLEIPVHLKSSQTA